MNKKHPLPPFKEESAKQKIQAAENAWNSKDSEKIALAYTKDSEWRNRSTFINGRAETIAFLKTKWSNELDYKLKKKYWSHSQNRIAVTFEYEWRDHTGQWFRSYGNKNWAFDENGLMKKRLASINDLPIKMSERRL